jgi:hypothetical protein
MRLRRTFLFSSCSAPSSRVLSWLTRRLPGDSERARELLGQALAAARELGLGNVERRGVELLKSSKGNTFGPPA